jgi:hypothetical protein
MPQSGLAHRLVSRRRLAHYLDDEGVRKLVTITRRYLAAAALATAISATAATAAQKQPQARPEAFEALVRCRSVTDDAARLQCFDAAAAALQSAAERRDVVVVDRKQVREAKRNLFGLDIPNLNPFGGGADDEEEIKSIEGVVASAYQDGNGRWVVRLEDGSSWAQTDNNPIVLRPRAGQKIKINKGALGSYMMRVNGQPGVRAKRQI